MTVNVTLQLNRLAIQGGKPVRTQPMPARAAIGQDEKNNIEAVLGWYAKRDLDPGYQGYFEALYCQQIIDFMGGGYADAVSSGSAAIYVALAALSLPPASEVLVSPITDPGTLSAIILLGLRPKLIDTQPNSYNVNLASVIARIDEHTRAVVLVHAAGQAISEVSAIAQYCQQHGIKVLEDCSQAHGARCEAGLVGTFGDIAAFSTMYRKASISGPTGGFIYTRHQKYYQQALAHADRGKPRWLADFDDRDPRQFLFPALNFHASEIACAIGVASWERLPATIRKRQNFVAQLVKQMAQSQVCWPMPIGVYDSPFYYPIFVDDTKIAVSKTEFAQAILQEGIGLNPHYRYLVQEWPWVQPYLVDTFQCEHAQQARDHSFCLYLNENYEQAEVDDIMAAILKVENYYLKK